MKHKHHDLMVAYAADTSLKIQYFSTIPGAGWQDLENPGFNPIYEYRVAPPPPPPQLTETIFIGRDPELTHPFLSVTRPANVKLTWEDGVLKKVEVL